MDPLQPSPVASPLKKVHRRTSVSYHGVRMREWGKWVSEIRIPKTKQRIWLGSYDCPEKAARAYDAARYCIHGERGQFNFPSDKRPELPKGHVYSLSKNDIKTIAYNFAVFDASVSSPVASLETAAMVTDEQASADLPVSSVTANPGDVEDNVLPSMTRAALVENVQPAAADAASDSLENLQLDDFLMLDIEWIDTL